MLVCPCGLLKATQDGFGAGEKLLYRWPNDIQLGVKPTGAGGEPMMFEAQKRADCPTNVVALCPRTPTRTPFCRTLLLEPAMILLNRPDLLGHLRTLAHGHRQVACRPVFRVTVWGINPKYQDKAIAFEMHAGTGFTDRTLRERALARSIGVDLAVRLEPGQPRSAVVADGLEIGEATVPTVEGHIARLKATRLGGRKHRTKVLVLGQRVDGLIKQPIVARDGGITVTPKQGQQIDARDNAMLFAGPMAMDQFDGAGIRLVERGIVADQQAGLPVDMLLSLTPKRQGVGFEPLQQACERIMRGAAGAIWLHAGGFGTRNHTRRSDKKIDVIEIGDFRFIHSRIIPHIAPTA